ncbi:MAG: hypothetical protein IPL40_03005 [Proteobacteria bacterium]|nr:hypothetical protein [Pseudomonadota bacterium]
MFLPLLALHPRLRGGLAQRLGWGWPPPPVDGRPGPVWFHGASAGDLRALLPLLLGLRTGGTRVVASCFTRSASEFLGAQGDAVPLLRAPLDLRWPVRRALDAIAPRLVVIEGLELWPTWIAACAQRGIACAIVNGRMSPRSLRWYRRFAFLFRPRFAALRLVVAVTAADAARFVAAGVPAARLRINSSSKHAACGPVARLDPAPPRSPGANGAQRLVLGSLHLAELRQLLPELGRLLSRWPRLEIDIFPRYVHQTDRLLRLLKASGLPCSRADQSNPGSSRAGSSRARVIVDGTMGRLARCYRGAVAAFVGGSLVPRGGHNLIEPAVHGVPVLHGPHVEHCVAEAALLAKRGGSTRVGDAAHFGQAVDRLLLDPAVAELAGRAARSAARQLQLDAERVALVLAPLVQ